MIDYSVLCSGIKNILLFGKHRCDSIPYVMLHPVALPYVCIGGLERFGVNETGIDTKTRGFSGDLHPIDPQACIGIGIDIGVGIGVCTSIGDHVAIRINDSIHIRPRLSLRPRPRPKPNPDSDVVCLV